MGTTYRYGFKPKGHGYTKWVTKQKPSKSRNTHKGTGILGDVVADVAARAIVGAVTSPPKRYKLCRDPSEAFRRRREADEALNRELDLPNNNHRFGGNKMDTLDQKIVDVFPGKIVRKDLTALMKRGANVPTFVLEYLLGMYCATDDEDAIEAGLAKIRKILSENYVRPDESEKIKSKIRENGEYTVIDIILTKSISRFARNTVDLLNTVRRLKELGIEVRFEKENINSLSGDGEVMLTLLASFAQEEVVSLSNNVKWATQKRFQQGLHNGRFQIYGYRWEGDQLIVHPEEAKIVKLIYDNFLKGLSAETTEKQLAEMGVKSCKGGHFGNGSIRQILSNITYTGNLLFQKEYTVDPVTKKSKINRGELPQYFVEDTHEAIIPMEVYQAVQAEKSRRRELGVFANWSINTTCFTSKIKCPHCGCSYVHNKRTKNGSLQEYWNCGSKKKKKVGDGCPVGGTISQKSLLKACAEVLGLPEFNEDVFLDQIDHIDVPEKYTLKFYFKDGTAVIKEAPNTGHQDCWTEEYRAAVSRRRMGKNNSKKYQNPFTGYFRCPNCGANFRRQTHKYKDGTWRIYWHCPNAPRCGNQAKPTEDTMCALLAGLLDLQEFEESTFKEKVDHIDLTGNYEATVFYRSGGTDIITWEPVPKKSYPHTEEYKERMRRRMTQYWTDERKSEMSVRVKQIRSEKFWASKRK